MNTLPGQLGLGVGVDLRYGDPYGFVRGGEREVVSPAILGFLERGAFTHAFFSFQRRDRGRLVLEDYAPAWDGLYASLPSFEATGLHHTCVRGRPDDVRGAARAFHTGAGASRGGGRAGGARGAGGGAFEVGGARFFLR